MELDALSWRGWGWVLVFKIYHLNSAQLLKKHNSLDKIPFEWLEAILVNFIANHFVRKYRIYTVLYRLIVILLPLWLMGSSICFAQTTSDRVSNCLISVLAELAIEKDHAGMASTREAIVKDFENRLIDKLEKMPPKIREEALASLEDVRINDTEEDFVKNTGIKGFADPKDLRIRLRKATSKGKIISLMFLGHEFDHIEFYARSRQMNPVSEKLNYRFNPIDQDLRTEFMAHGFQYDVVQGMFKAAGNPKEFFRFIIQETGISESDAHDMATLLEVLRVKGKKATLPSDPKELAKLTSDSDRFVEILQTGKLKELIAKIATLMDDDMGVLVTAQINSTSRNKFVMNSLWANGYIKKLGVSQSIRFLAYTFASYWMIKKLAALSDDDAKKKSLPQKAVPAPGL